MVRLILVLLSTLVLVQAAKKLPDYVQVCHRSDADFDGCVLRSIEALRSRIGRGIPQLRVPGLEPLVIPGLHIDRSNDALELNAQLDNLKVSGGSKFIINSLKTSLEDHGVRASITLPELQFSTDYDVKGRLLLVPLTGKGSIDGTFKNVKADLTVKANIMERKNKKYLQISNFQSDVSVGDSKFNFNKPKTGDGPRQAISSAATSFINENKQQVLQLIKPIVEDTVSELFQGIMNGVLQVIPYDTLLPE